MIEASPTRTIMLVLPALEDPKRKMCMIANGVREATSFSEVICGDEALVSSTLVALQKILLHDFWAAACLFHPGLRALAFVQDTSVRDE